MFDLRTTCRSVLSLVLLSLFSLVAHASTAAEDPVLQALDLELKRSVELLQSEESAPYFIGLEVMEIESLNIMGEEGGLQGYRPARHRWIHADVRLGGPRLDSSHPLRDDGWENLRSGANEEPLVLPPPPIATLKSKNE